jgi:hypothetical protein
MSMILPNLDDVTWEQLNEEARSLIPAYAPDWTNFNPSDPGITLLELLAYFVEMLLYRANRISDEQRLCFLRLLNGPGWKAVESLDDERRHSLLALAIPLRAVTAEDFERLAIAAAHSKSAQMTVEPGAGRIARAKCLADRNLEGGDAATNNSPAPGHVSVIVVPHRGTEPSKPVLRDIKEALDAARLITTRVHVMAPTYVTFGVRITLFTLRQASTDSVGKAAMKRLMEFYDPFHGGPDERGWPFGRNVYVSELYQLLSLIPGVDYVTRSTGVNGEDQEELIVDPSSADRRRLNGEQELESIEVHDEELVCLKVNPGDILVRGKASRRT